VVFNDVVLKYIHNSMCYKESLFDLNYHLRGYGM
jgi:hypothetical protein